MRLQWKCWWSFPSEFTSESCYALWFIHSASICMLRQANSVCACVCVCVCVCALYVCAHTLHTLTQPPTQPHQQIHMLHTATSTHTSNDQQTRHHTHIKRSTNQTPHTHQMINKPDTTHTSSDQQTRHHTHIMRSTKQTPHTHQAINKTDTTHTSSDQQNRHHAKHTASAAGDPASTRSTLTKGVVD